MLLSRIAPLGALLFLSATLAGCTANAPADEPVSSTEALTAETFKMYSDLEVDPSDHCDVHTTLTLSSGSEGNVKEAFARGALLRAHLYDAANGSCKIYVDPAPRDYTLLFESDECGSVVYKAATTVDGRTRAISVTDHRKRTCWNYIAPAKIVVEEEDESGEVRTFYSSDGTKAGNVS